MPRYVNPDNTKTLRAIYRALATTAALTVALTGVPAAIGPSAAFASTGAPSCKAVKPILTKYLKIKSTSFFSVGKGISDCLFTLTDGYSGALNMVPTNLQKFDETKVSSAADGSKVVNVSGLGKAAFAVYQKGTSKLTGMNVLGNNNILYSLTSPLSLSDSEALLKAVMALG
jgi:hypothetical protein